MFKEKEAAKEIMVNQSSQLNTIQKLRGMFMNGTCFLNENGRR